MPNDNNPIQIASYASLDFGGDDDGLGSRSGGERRAGDRGRRAVGAETKGPYTPRAVVRDIEKLRRGIDGYPQDASANGERRTADGRKPARCADSVARDFSVAERPGEKEAAFGVHGEAAWVGSGSEGRACQGRGRAIDLINGESRYGSVRRVSEIEEMAGRIDHQPKRVLADACREWRGGNWRQHS